MTCATCCVKGVGFVVVCFDVEEKVTMLLLVLGHGTKMRVLRGTYKRSLETMNFLVVLLKQIFGSKICVSLQHAYAHVRPLILVMYMPNYFHFLIDIKLFRIILLLILYFLLTN